MCVHKGSTLEEYLTYTHMTLIHWLASVGAILVAAYLLPGVTITTPLAAVILAIVLGIINVFVKPVISLLTLPITIVTLGIFSLVINALFVMFADWIVDGFAVNGFWWALAFSVVVSLVNGFFHLLIRD